MTALSDGLFHTHLIVFSPFRALGIVWIRSLLAATLYLDALHFIHNVCLSKSLSLQSRHGLVPPAQWILHLVMQISLSIERDAMHSPYLSHVCRIIESTTRSLNNLIEHLHQSFFFYFLPNNDRYVSIGLYMPSVLLIIAACLLMALSLWIRVYQSSEAEERSKKTEATAPWFKNALILAMWVMILGLSCSFFLLLVLFSVPGASVRLDVSLLLTFVVAPLLFGTIERAMCRRLGHLLIAHFFNLQFELMRSLLLHFAALLLTLLSMMNYSLAALLACPILILPLLASRPTTNATLNQLQRLCWISLYYVPLLLAFLSSYFELGLDLCHLFVRHARYESWTLWLLGLSYYAITIAYYCMTGLYGHMITIKLKSE